MKLNWENYPLLVSNANEYYSVKADEKAIAKSKYEKLLGIKNDKQQSFNEHVQLLRKRVDQKVNSLSPISILINFSKIKLSVNAFIISDFFLNPVLNPVPNSNIELSYYLSLWKSSNNSKKDWQSAVSQKICSNQFRISSKVLLLCKV